MILVHNFATEAALARPYFESTVGYNKMAAACNNNKSADICVLDVSTGGYTNVASTVDNDNPSGSLIMKIEREICDFSS